MNEGPDKTEIHQKENKYMTEVEKKNLNEKSNWLGKEIKENLTEYEGNLQKLFTDAVCIHPPRLATTLSIFVFFIVWFVRNFSPSRGLTTVVFLDIKRI